jgi:hypothetical protein
MISISYHDLDLLTFDFGCVSPEAGRAYTSQKPMRFPPLNQIYSCFLCHVASYVICMRSWLYDWARSIPLIRELPYHWEPQLSDVAHGPLVYFYFHNRKFWWLLPVWLYFARYFESNLADWCKFQYRRKELKFPISFIHFRLRLEVTVKIFNPVLHDYKQRSIIPEYLRSLW